MLFAKDLAMKSLLPIILVISVIINESFTHVVGDILNHDWGRIRCYFSPSQVVENFNGITSSLNLLDVQTDVYFSRFSDVMGLISHFLWHLHAFDSYQLV